MKKLIVLTALLASSASYAQLIKLKNKQCLLPGATPNRTQICNDLFDELETHINGSGEEIKFENFTQAMANANALASKGTASDYADNYSLFVVDANIAAAIDAPKGFSSLDKIEGISDMPGLGIGGGLTVGVNLSLLPIDKIAFLELNKMDLSFNFLTYNIDQDQGEVEMDGSIKSFGFMARYKIIDEINVLPGYLVQWGGLHLHTGLQRNSMSINVTSSPKDESFEVDGQEADLQDMKAKLSIDAANTAIPVEVSTFVRLGYVFTFFGGLGTDFNVGSAQTELKGSGDITSSAIGADISTKEDADEATKRTWVRAFGGVQFNIPFVRVYVAGQKVLGQDTVAANAGLKILF
jgi:hypothetical protein